MTSLAYPHVLVAGTPENINDVEDNFQAIKTWANGNVDATNLAATADPVTLMGRYSTVDEVSLRLDSTYTGATTYTGVDGGTGAAPMAAGLTSTATAMICPINLADYAVSGLTTQFRVQASTITNTIAPGVSFTFGLYGIASVIGVSSNIGFTLTAAVAGSGVTRTTPAASSNFVDWSSDFTGSNGTWLLGVASSGTPAANSMTQFRIRLQVHNI
jgi:hypothetical protein